MQIKFHDQKKVKTHNDPNRDGEEKWKHNKNLWQLFPAKLWNLNKIKKVFFFLPRCRKGKESACNSAITQTTQIENKKTISFSKTTTDHHHHRRHLCSSWFLGERTLRAKSTSNYNRRSS